jgi:hypothetical protein
MITPNPRCFGVWGVIGKRVEVENPNGVSAKCAIAEWLRSKGNNFPVAPADPVAPPQKKTSLRICAFIKHRQATSGKQSCFA